MKGLMGLLFLVMAVLLTEYNPVYLKGKMTIPENHNVEQIITNGVGVAGEWKDDNPNG